MLALIKIALRLICAIKLNRILIKHAIIPTTISILIIFLSPLLIIGSTVSAQPACGNADSCERQAESCVNDGGSWNETEGFCTFSNEPSYIESDCNDSDINQDNCGIVKYLVLFINFLSGIVGIVVVGSIIYGGIQYSTAGSDPQKVSAAKSRIRNAIIALIFFLFMYSLLNYLVPGGVLR
jgi:hypothetical protein